MRIVDKNIHQQATSGLNKSRFELADLQQKASLQKKVDRPSVDPLAAARVLAQRSEQEGISQYLKNIKFADSQLQYTDQSLGELAEALMRAKELALSQAQDAGANEVTRKTVASEIEQIYWAVVQIGNRKLGERYIFGGTKTTSAPFDTNGRYWGDDANIFVQVDKDSYISLNLPGSEVFLGKRRVDDKVIKLDNLPKNVEDLAAPPSGPQQTLGARGLAFNDINKNQPIYENVGVNVFEVLRGLEISLKANDKVGVQDSLEALDAAIQQAIQARSKAGARVMALRNAEPGLETARVNSRAIASELEDADTFSVVNDINKAENALKTNLSTSAKLIQPSLLDFLR